MLSYIIVSLTDSKTRLRLRYNCSTSDLDFLCPVDVRVIATSGIHFQPIRRKFSSQSQIIFFQCKRNKPNKRWHICTKLSITFFALLFFINNFTNRRVILTYFLPFFSVFKFNVNP